jgi:hypothetical protein
LAGHTTIQGRAPVRKYREVLTMNTRRAFREHGEAEVWVGCISVRPRCKDSILGTAIGGYMYALAWACSAHAYRAAVAAALEEVGLEVDGVEELEPFAWRLSVYRVSDEWLQKAREVEATKTPRFGTLHAFDGEDDSAR